MDDRDNYLKYGLNSIIYFNETIGTDRSID